MACRYTRALFDPTPRPMRVLRHTRNWLIPLLLPGMGLLAGCAGQRYAERLPFTDGLSAEYRLSGAHKRQLQYYVSDTIRLVRSRSGGETGVRDGRLVSRSARDIEQIVIDGGTPGVVLASGSNWMAVSFERGSYLYFVSNANRSAWLGDDQIEDAYYLYLPDYNGQGGTVRLGNQAYTATDDSFRAHLLVRRESMSDVSARQSRQPGRHLR